MKLFFPQNSLNPYFNKNILSNTVNAYFRPKIGIWNMVIGNISYIYFKVCLHNNKTSTIK